jgi:predicted nuclease of restriction endonuclease-like (RecB) superfamily
MQIEKTFITDIKTILSKARTRAFAIANSEMLNAYWLVGKRISQQELKGARKAQYGTFIIRELSSQLLQEFGKGFEERELRRMRQFYLYFPEQTDLRFELTWTHYRYILRIEDPKVRTWYVSEAITQGWNTRQLERNINSQYYNRILSTREPLPISSLPSTATTSATPSHLLKDPYLFEFLGLEMPGSFSENELETAIINKLQHFLLEMGKGYAFVARQYHIRTDTKEFYIDLVFYNYLLKGFVLVDLKINELTHQDIGQMDMYVRLWDDLKKLDGDHPTIGIILCSDKDETIVKYSTLNENKQLFASKYRLFLPDEQQLAEEIDKERQRICPNA